MSEAPAQRNIQRFAPVAVAVAAVAAFGYWTYSNDGGDDGAVVAGIRGAEQPVVAGIRGTSNEGLSATMVQGEPAPAAADPVRTACQAALVAGDPVVIRLLEARQPPAAGQIAPAPAAEDLAQLRQGSPEAQACADAFAAEAAAP